MIFRKSAVGSNYPNVSISNLDHSQGVERSYFRYWLLNIAYQCLLIETANMLIMTYAYARASGDGSFIKGYVRINCIFSPRGTDGVLIV